MSDIKERLRDAVQKLRRTPMAIADVAPMLTGAADRIATLEAENTALRVSVEAAVLHAQKGWARSNTSTQSTDQQNVSINGGNIDVSTQEVG